MTLDTIHLVITAAVGLLSSVAGAGGSWALLRYRLDKTETAAKAAHKRLDELSPRVLSLEVRVDGHGKQIDDGLSALRSDIQELTARIDRILEARR